ncbi:MAG: type II toxin-antitoxin system VapC family toxin [Candidatus Rokuibacteriota bacterium]
MPDVLVDSNVLLDVLTEDRTWFARSAMRLAALAEDHALIINPIIYAEVSIGFDRIEDLDVALAADVFHREDLPWEAAFLAGKCYLKYCRSGGSTRSPLPDFCIGAHAAVRGIPLLTRDRGRYRGYFPRLQLVLP